MGNQITESFLQKCKATDKFFCGGCNKEYTLVPTGTKYSIPVLIHFVREQKTTVEATGMFLCHECRKQKVITHEMVNDFLQIT